MDGFATLAMTVSILRRPAYGNAMTAKVSIFYIQPFA
jgi:hypothetical protein